MSLNIFYQKRQKELYVDSTRIHCSRKLRCSPHLHQELEIVFYYGGVSNAHSDSTCHRLRAGDVFLTFPNQIHFFETYAPEDFIIFIAKTDLMPELADVFNMSVPVSAVIHDAANDPTIKMLAERILIAETERQRDGGGTYVKPLIRGCLLALFSEILRRMPVTGISVEDSDTLRTIVAYCSNNFSSNLSLSALEENLHLNKFYISHLFNDRLGLRFNDYINSLRVSEACRYLLNSNHNITEISDLVGFNTLRTFNRAFLRQMGVTPSEYRSINSGAPSASPAGQPLLPTEEDPCV